MMLETRKGPTVLSARLPDLGAARVLAMVLLLAGGCAGPGTATAPSPDSGSTRVPAAPVRDPAVVAALIERYNDRVRLLDQMYARGVIEFRWVDRDGEEHFEPQINAKLWVDLPRRTALRGEKLGETYIWLGSDADRYWMFDLAGDTRRLYVGRHDTFTEQDAVSVLVRPVTLLDLLGLTPLPAFEPAATSFDEARTAWVVRVEGAGGPMRVFLDPTSALPVRVESLDDAGEIVLFSDLGRYAAVRIGGMSVLALPRAPTLIDISNPEGTVAVKLAFGDVTGETAPRVFDLRGLIDHLRPERIEGATEGLGDAASVR